MANSREPFESDTIYHIYNHGNGDSLVFLEDENYRFFLERFRKYISPVAKIYAFCLMPNHFHFLIRIKSEDELVEHFKEMYPARRRSNNEERSAMSQKDIADLSDLVSRQFKNFLISYSKSFNSMYNRRGSLFLDNIERISIREDEYFTNMIRYIHFNPVLHRFTSTSEEWKYNSIHAYYSEKRSSICRKAVFEWFGGSKQFRKFHQSIQEDEFDSIKHFTLE